MPSRVRRFLQDENCSTAIEYALIAAMIALALVAVLHRVGGEVNVKLGSVANNLS